MIPYWINKSSYSIHDEIPTLKDWLEFIGVIWGLSFSYSPLLKLVLG